MKGLELFAGSRSFSKVAESYGMETFAIDINPFDNIDLVADINLLEPKDIPFTPSIIWASIPCTTFSVCQIGTHWNKDHSPKTIEAWESISLIIKTLDIINHFLKINPELVYYIENPRGKLRRLIPVYDQLDRRTIWYCKYKDEFKRAKPTDIWSNNFKDLFNPDGWNPRPECFNGKIKCDHEPSPRGCSTTGTQGLKSAYTRSIIPKELCEEIITQYINQRVKQINY